MTTLHNDKLVIKERLYGPALFVDGHNVLIGHLRHLVGGAVRENVYFCP